MTPETMAGVVRCVAAVLRPLYGESHYAAPGVAGRLEAASRMARDAARWQSAVEVVLLPSGACLVVREYHGGTARYGGGILR
jgi:hypothetical protein